MGGEWEGGIAPLCSTGKPDLSKSRLEMLQTADKAQWVEVTRKLILTQQIDKLCFHKSYSLMSQAALGLNECLPVKVIRQSLLGPLDCGRRQGDSLSWMRA